MGRRGRQCTFSHPARPIYWSCPDGRPLPSRSEEFEALIASHARLVSHAIRSVCGKRGGHLIPDVEQEVRLALWKALEGGKKIEHPVSYLYKVALTTAAAIMRKSLSNRETSAPEALAAAGAAAAEPVADAERRVVLQQSLSRLPGDQARALRGYLAGFNHKEVAALFGWTEAAARHHIYRGLDRLRSMAEARSEGD